MQALQQILLSDYLQKGQFLNFLPIAVYVCDMSGVIINYNTEAAKLCGLNTADVREELFCTSYKLYQLDGTLLPRDQTPVAACIRDGQSRKDVELIMERADGSRLIVRVNIAPLKDEEGNQMGVVNCFYDITSQKRTEKELESSKQRYYKMIEEVEDYAIILLDKNGIIQNWNRGAEKIKGYKEAEIVGKSFRIFYLDSDRKAGLPDRLITKAREEGKAMHEGWRRRKDGTAFWGSIVLTALHNDQNQVIGFSKVTRDLTARKLAEDKLKEYTVQLEFQNEQLEQFAYAASHDMKEPLRKILFYGNHLLETVADGLPEKEREYLHRSVNAANRMKSLIDDLLEYSRASSEGGDFEQIDLNEVADEIILSHKEVIEEKNAIVRFSSLPVIQGIPFQMRQLFDNLLSNSLKYHHPEKRPEVQISSERISGRPTDGLDPQTDYFKISFCDNGIGFDSRHAEKIFELFQRLPGGDKSGTGVGLALCKRIVQNHNGLIKATGQANEGACFEVYLPA